MNDSIQEMIKEASSIEWDCIYSSKGHFNAAMLWNSIHYILGISAAICAVVAGLETTSSAWPFLSATLAAMITFLKPTDKVELHHRAGIEFTAVRRESRMFQNIDVYSDELAQTKMLQLKELAEKTKKMNLSSPAIPWVAYQITRWGVRRGEATYDELDEKK